MISELHDDFLDSSAILSDAKALRATMSKHGYLFFRGLLDREAVGRVRAEILAVCRRHGWLQPGAAGDDGYVDLSASCVPADPPYNRVYAEVISIQAYNALAHAEPILRLMAALFDASDVIPRPAKRSHLIFPQDDFSATPPHQDFPHEQGAVQAYTTWIPLGDCPRELGGLAVWPGSLHRDVIEHGFVPGVGGLGIAEDKMPDAQWSTVDYEIGDVLVFHSLTAHGALPNRTPDRLRISADYRFQRASDPFSDHMLRPTGGKLTWEQVYANWDSDELKYYWKDLSLVSEPYDHRYYDKRDSEVFDLARAGDPHAVEFLKTISTRNPDPAIRQAAGDLMAAIAAGSGSAS